MRVCVVHMQSRHCQNTQARTLYPNTDVSSFKDFFAIAFPLYLTWYLTMTENVSEKRRAMEKYDRGHEIITQKTENMCLKLKKITFLVSLINQNYFSKLYFIILIANSNLFTCVLIWWSARVAISTVNQFNNHRRMYTSLISCLSSRVTTCWFPFGWTLRAEHSG